MKYRINVILPHDSVLIYLKLWKDQRYNACTFANENVNCMLRHFAYVLSKLILKLFEQFQIMLSI